MDLFEVVSDDFAVELESTAEEITLAVGQSVYSESAGTSEDTAEYFDCDACGTCPTPNKCVSSIICPECLAEQSELCRDVRAGDRVTAYHEARWVEVHKLYGTYYK